MGPLQGASTAVSVKVHLCATPADRSHVVAFYAQPFADAGRGYVFCTVAHTPYVATVVLAAGDPTGEYTLVFKN